MSDATTTGENSMADPLRTAADAMALAAQAAKDGAADAQARVSEAIPAINRFLSRLTYTSFYSLAYGVVFPTMLLVRAIPQENALVHGLVDGGAAARDAVAKMRKEKASEGDPPAEAHSGDSPETPPPHPE
jgi:hypothetical protein